MNFMNIQTLEKVLESDLNLGHYCLLKIIEQNNSINSQNTLINGWINALIKRSLIIKVNENYQLTDKGKEELFKITGNSTIQTNEEYLKEEKLKITNTQSLEEFSTQLHAKITTKIKELTSKTNFRNTSGKMLNSNLADFKNRLEVFFKKYKNVDAPYDKIERVVLKYIEQVCTGERKYALTVLYFIWKVGEKDGLISEMLERIENLEDEVAEIKKQINTKELF